jgi:hypothetical protein|tara:strand:- start:699 stop:1382 length:684 start_codon:yes stop_codon:yes gene_type:complete
MHDTQISFIITSKRDSIYINRAVSAVKNVCSGNGGYEIIFTSERQYVDIDSDVKYINTNYYTSVENYNEGFNHASYEWICLLTDDIHLVQDPRERFHELPEEYPQSHIFNIHKESYIHKIIDHSNHVFEYPVIYIPCIHRKIIEDEFAGKILSECFKHHYVDHWTGMFLKMQYPNFKVESLSCTQDGDLYTDSTHTEYDRCIYEGTVMHIRNNNKYYGYNGLFNLTF